MKVTKLRERKSRVHLGEARVGNKCWKNW